jgi:hypothetical protein
MKQRRNPHQFEHAYSLYTGYPDPATAGLCKFERHGGLADHADWKRRLSMVGSLSRALFGEL